MVARSEADTQGDVLGLVGWAIVLSSRRCSSRLHVSLAAGVQVGFGDEKLGTNLGMSACGQPSLLTVVKPNECSVVSYRDDDRRAIWLDRKAGGRSHVPYACPESQCVVHRRIALADPLVLRPGTEFADPNERAHNRSICVGGGQL
jgi:hypothetical protein